MPLIKLEYDDDKIDSVSIEKLSQAVRDIVSEVTSIKDVFVYANAAQIKIQIAPVEIFIEMSASKIEDPKELTNDIKAKISKWKSETKFETSINLTLIPMDWVVEIDI